MLVFVEQCLYARPLRERWLEFASSPAVPCRAMHTSRCMQIRGAQAEALCALLGFAHDFGALLGSIHGCAIMRIARPPSSALLRRAFLRDRFYNPSVPRTVTPEDHANLRTADPTRLREYLRLVADLIGWKPAQWARAARIAPSTLNRFLNQDVGHTLSATTLRKLVAAALTHARTEGMNPSLELRQMIEKVRHAALGEAEPPPIHHPAVTLQSQESDGQGGTVKPSENFETAARLLAAFSVEDRVRVIQRAAEISEARPTEKVTAR
jgi:tellurite resistance protein